MADPQPFKHPPSHLDVEHPKFKDTPHIWIQWKGTDVCADIRCQCGASHHFDGDFFYFFRCPDCGQVWEVGTHVTIYPVDTATDERFKSELPPIVEEITRDRLSGE